jgi:DNA (cytosine-5)-methyltransferase 1
MTQGLIKRGTIVDLYSGCGGFTLGAELSGFRSLAAVDIEPLLQSGYRRNFPQTRAIQASVADLEASDWRQILGKQRPDGVIGGPPCQGFSAIGKRDSADPRNMLIDQFFRQVALLQPKFFIMENVQGLLHEDKVGFLKAAMSRVASRYTIIEPFIVNAKDFGAPTQRKRVVVVGFDPCEMNPISKDDIFSGAVTSFTNVHDAIADLPTPIDESFEEEDDLTWASYPASPGQVLSSYAQRMRKPPPAGLGSQDAIERRLAGQVSGMARTIHSQRIAERYAAIEGGRVDKISKSAKLKWDGFCPTLRAGTGAEKGSFQAVRPLHPAAGRVICVREAARLQGFPDWFGFHPAKWHSFRMIGNSVSPVVSQAIFERIHERLQLPLAA